MIGSIAPWFGSKRTLAPEIIHALGPHRSYWEPFCGSLAVLLAKPLSSQEQVCDLHRDLTNLAWILQREAWAVELYGRLARTLMTEDLYRASQRTILAGPAGDDPDSDRAYHYMIASWMGRNGLAGTYREDSQIAIRWTSRGGSPAGRFRAVVESVPWWHERLRQVLILRRDAFDVLGKIEDEKGTAIYADPPYLMSTRKGDRGGGKYRHDFSINDHNRLAAALSRFRLARVVVSYYDAPELVELYPDWHKIDCARKKQLSLQQRRGAVIQDAPEVLLVNERGGLFDSVAS